MMKFMVEDALRWLIDDFQSGKLSVDCAYNIRANKDQVRGTMVSCLLSSGWNYEKALKASNLFVQEFPSSQTPPSEKELEKFLSSARIRHRFPVSKAKQLHSSIVRLNSFPSDFLFEATNQKEERIVREVVQKRFSGLGYKQTSMFLRNIGAATSLAVIDAHIIWYLEVALGVKSGNITKKRYIELEDIVRDLSDRFEIEMNYFDIILWVLVRELKKNERAKACGTQYVLPLAA